MSDETLPADPVLFTVEEGVGRITLHRPEALNALDIATLLRLREILDEVTASADVRAVLLTGAGRAFCAGGDIRTMLSITDEKPEGQASPQRSMLEGVGHLHPILAGLARLPKPVIAAVNGPAAGAGVGLALVADITWAAASSTFSLAFTGIGVSPDSGTTYTLPRAVGPKMAAELFLTNRSLSADEALAAGLVSRVLDEAELLPAARKLARRLAAGATLAFGRVKELLRSSGAGGFETQLENERQAVGRSATTRDFAEGLQAFVEKRAPNFEGR